MALIKETDHLRIPFQDLEIATKNFATTLIIGRGGFGKVYKGELSLLGKLTSVAVKRLDANISGQGFKEFLTEIHLLSRFKHPNLVSLLGYCQEGNEKILVYEYAEHGSLDKLLTKDTTVCPLTCKQLIDVCIDAASCLDYLHHHAAENQRVIHRDIKSANILLDHNWKAMISDLGLSKLGRANEPETFVITHPCGTNGYCDPVYKDTGVLTKESDVYSFGMVLFEVLCRRLYFMNVNDERKFLDRLVHNYNENGKLHEIIHPDMMEQLPPASLDKISKIACQCLLNDREKRPSMGLVVKKLKEALEVPEMDIVGELGIFWLEDDIKSLVKRLTSQMDMFVPIVGEQGSGKTTLARAVYKKIKDDFDYHDWISVGEEYTAERILSRLKKITATVKGRRYLIVVDGIGSYEVLQDLKDAFPDAKNGSKVIFTSRETPEMMKLNPHIMNRLDEDQSWKMFLNKAGKEKEAGRITESLKHKILRICNGLPRNIILMAGLLSNNRIKRWPLVIDDGRFPDDILRLCYNNLKIRSKVCLLYLALFPKDYVIPVRRLLRLWVAKGFVKRRLQDPFPEDLAQKCFEKLVGLNMIQITKLRLDNSPKRCRLVSFFHDYLLPKAQDISRFYIRQNSKNFQDAMGPVDVRLMVPGIITTRVGMVSGKTMRTDFVLLRVLDLEGARKRSLPDAVGHLSHLRYLGLRRTFLEWLPESVGDLSYLETLDLKQTCVNSLPDSIWKLKRLRHLNLTNVRLTMPPSCSSTLLTLWGLVLDDRISADKLEGLITLLNLRELGIRYQLSTGKQDVLLDWIEKLVDLQSLRLVSLNGSRQASELVLKTLATLAKLSQLNLYGNLSRLPTANEFPPTVKALTLSISRLKKDPMETLGQLPCLIVLRLLGDSFTGERMVCLRGGFKQLEVLKIWKLKGLEEWDVEEEAMENLKELDIRRCHKLKNIPCRLLIKPKRLEILKVTDMPNDFVGRIGKGISKRTTLTVN
ncbi:putative protein kinase RLK-Pelle-CrRLK1L-1 family [Helianthus annuus]|uniref:Protein kinase domain-containing protein n=2 Tax=Helianthus annuus TaxID=4232 RepID=A0A9K3NCQ3_HELAN|nr:probable disease resistance protein RF9 [Helianthus annuus]XP_021970161.1 probable disease resistance protein RF9 [Helianthus annuus]KAF5795454.1 putative protein kinase RLK-Pelle-CrRLK1L-1 family [Helianthus annuus]KAJ0719257.1 putative protein kinase RLK-Pelle-CrRLK1L-1 family [Helianthus annuus]KAJ0722493.1 putative protein kinase RLK-Pelle-CrRLK1L-1 family [Helianthus annuus]